MLNNYDSSDKNIEIRIENKTRAEGVGIENEGY